MSNRPVVHLKRKTGAAELLGNIAALATVGLVLATLSSLSIWGIVAAWRAILGG